MTDGGKLLSADVQEVNKPLEVSDFLNKITKAQFILQQITPL